MTSQYANVMGMQKDLGMKGNDFSWGATGFFLAYTVAEFFQGIIRWHAWEFRLECLLIIDQALSFNDTLSQKSLVVIFSAGQSCSAVPALSKPLIK
jgi:hypothetical protein